MACLIIIFVIFFGFVLDRVAFYIGGPLWSVRTSLVSTLDNVGAYFSSKSTLEKKNEELQSELDQKNADILLKQDQLDLYKGLDAYVAKKDIKADEYIVKVVTRPPQTPFDELIIDLVGNAIQDGQTVYYAGVPVGHVTMHAGSYARVSLFSHPASQFKALVSSKKIVGDAKGKSNGNIVITLPKSSDIKVGDIAYVAEGTIPFGTVSNIDDNVSQSFIDVYVELPFSPYRVDWLTIKKN